MKYLLIILTLALASCNLCKRAVKKGCITTDTVVTTTIKDTIIYRDTVIFVDMPQDTIKDTIVLKVKDNVIKPIHKVFKSQYMTIKIDVVNNKMSVDATINRQKLQVLIEGAVVKHLRSVITEKTITKKVRVNELTRWQVFRMWMGNILLICIVIMMLYILLRSRIAVLKRG